MELVIGDGERRTAHQLVRDTLRRAILTGQIPGGERLVQAELAQQLQVSTTPVREALRDLAAEGLIRLDAHRGAIVHSLSQQEVEEIYRIRQLLEPEVMERAIRRISETQIEQAALLHEQAKAEKDPAAWVELNRQFHRVFLRAADSPRLSGIVETLQDSAAMYIVASLMRGIRTTEEANAQHGELLDAVRARDVATARRAITEHIHATIDSVPAFPERA